MSMGFTVSGCRFQVAGSLREAAHVGRISAALPRGKLALSFWILEPAESLSGWQPNLVENPVDHGINKTIHRGGLARSRSLAQGPRSASAFPRLRIVLVLVLVLVIVS